MLTSGQTDFAPPAPAWAGVGTCTLPEALAAVRRPAPARLPYHMLALTTAGHGTVEVDFTTEVCRPGTLLWIRPGQAVRFGGQPGMDAALGTWEANLLPADQGAGGAIDDPGGPAPRPLARGGRGPGVSEGR